MGLGGADMCGAGEGWEGDNGGAPTVVVLFQIGSLENGEGRRSSGSVLHVLEWEIGAFLY